VCLAAAERGLELDNRLASLAVKPLRHLYEQEPHALGDKGPLEKRGGVLVFMGCLARSDSRDVSRKLGLLERAFEHVGMRDGDFAPRFQVHRI
jgi:hypothetical protein